MLLTLIAWICRDGPHEFQLDFQSRLRDVLKSRGSVRAFVAPMIRGGDDDDDDDGVMLMWRTSHISLSDYFGGGSWQVMQNIQWGAKSGKSTTPGD